MLDQNIPYTNDFVPKVSYVSVCGAVWHETIELLRYWAASKGVELDLPFRFAAVPELRCAPALYAAGKPQIHHCCC